jgi:predicted small metal-binding protein
MYTLADKDMGIDCDFVAEGDTMEAVLKASKDHGISVHSEKMAEMMKTHSEEQMMDMMKKAVKGS